MQPLLNWCITIKDITRTAKLTQSTKSHCVSSLKWVERWGGKKIPMPKIEFNDMAIRKITEPGRYGFGRGHLGLCIQADFLSDDSLSRTWEQRIRIKGKGKDGTAKPVDLGLGKYPLISVVNVKKEAEFNAALAAQGIDPREHFNSIPIFRTATEGWIEESSKDNSEDNSKGWSDKHAQFVTRIMINHCFPHIGDARVDKIGYGDLGFIRPLCLTIPPTADKLISYMEKVFAKCEFEGYIERNPINDVFKSQVRQGGHETEHHPALPTNRVPDAMAAIDQRTRPDIATRSYLKGCLLNGVRPHSAFLAEWPEIRWKEIRSDDDWEPNGWDPVDWNALDGNTKTIVWRIPGEHMKKGKPFVVPVSTHFFEILKEMRDIRGQGKRNSKLIFAGQHGGTVSRTAVSKLLQSLGYPSDTEGRKPTLHGCRSTFRTWAERRNVPRIVSEAALSHDTGSKVEVTYMRWDLLEKRVRLMQAYADYAMGKLPQGWVWIEPEAEAQIEAQKRRAEEAEERAAKAERELAMVRAELAEIKSDFAEMKVMLRDIKSLIPAA